VGGAGSQSYFMSSSEDCVCLLSSLSSACVNVNLLLPYELKSGRYYGGAERALRLKSCSVLCGEYQRYFCKIFAVVFCCLHVIFVDCDNDNCKCDWLCLCRDKRSTNRSHVNFRTTFSSSQFLFCCDAQFYTHIIING